MLRILRRRRCGTVSVLAIVTAILATTLSPGLTPQASAQDYPFRNPDLPLRTRIDDLIGRLSLDEKVSLLHQYQPAIPRLDIRAFKTGTEALHGVAWLGKATVFPQAIGLGNTWNPGLMKKIGNVVGKEARGFHARDPEYNGLNLWAPVTNLLRDPRWGRNEEGYSEDPLLTSELATAYGKGIQGNHPRYLQAAPTLKHYLAYNNEVDRTTTSSVIPPKILHDYDRKAFEPSLSADAATGVMPGYNLVNGRPSTVSPELTSPVRDWTDKDLLVVSDAGAPTNLTESQAYYDTPAQAAAGAIKAGIDSFTDHDTDPGPSIAAIKAALDQGLLAVADVDRAVGHILSIRFRLGEFDPPGLNPYEDITPKVIDSPAHRKLARTAANEQMVLLRNDNNMLPLDASELNEVAVVGQLSNKLYEDWYSGTMPYEVTPAQAVAERIGPNGQVSTSEAVDRIALKNLATGKYVTAPTAPEGGTLTASAAANGKASALDVLDWGENTVTLRAAANGKYVSLGAGGTLVNNAEQPHDWYVQQQFSLEKLADGSYVLRYSGNDRENRKYVRVAQDGTLVADADSADTATRFDREVTTSGVDSAVKAATGADVAIVVAGSMPFINGREDDDRQTTILPAAQRRVIDAVRKANPRTVVVLESSYPYSGDWDTNALPALLWTTHAGQETGNAVADVLFGDYNPGGRVTQTWYRSDADIPDILHYDIAKSGHTYQYFRGKPLFPFGYGLSYTTFDYSKLRLSSSSIDSTGRVRLSVDVTNTGSRAGDEVVQLYSHQRESRVQQPIKQLRGFQRVHLRPGQTETVEFTVAATDLAFWDVTRNREVVETTTHDLQIGRSATEVEASASLTVRGEMIPPRDLSAPTQAQNFDDYSGTILVDKTKSAGTAVAATAPGQWISFRDADFGAGTSRVTAEVSNPSRRTTIEVRVGDPLNGRRVATIPVPVTGDRYAWTTASADVAGLAGRQDVYLVFTGPAQVNTVTFVPSK